MSSEISIERGSLKAQAGGSTAGELTARRPAADEGFRPWHFFVLASILLATVAVIMARRSAPEHLILISFTIAAAGGAAAAFYRMLVPLTAPLVLRMGEPVNQRTRAALEREKALVLRSIKELEFDRAMGKVSQQDFDEMAGRLRARALSLMKQLDLGSAGYAIAIEEELRKRFQGSQVPGFQGSVQGSRVQGSRVQGSQVHGSAVQDAGVQGAAVRVACGCGTANDPDAVFCKTCGTRLGA